MKIFFSALVVLSLFATPAWAAGDLKIGYIITPDLMSQCQAGKDAAQELKGRLEAAQQGLESKLKEIKALEADIEKRKMVLSDEERGKVMAEHERQMRDAKRMREDSQQELSKVEADVMGRVNEFLREIIVKFAKTHDYDVILDASTLLYISEKANVTEAVVAVADADYKKK
jgi:Skp family chaperone for outer membrane proteins